MVASWLAVCVTHRLGLAIIFWGHGGYPGLGFCLHADSVVLVDFLHVLRSIEVRFISAPNPFEQTLGFLCRNYSFINPFLSMFGMKWCVFVSKSGQSGTILFLESINILERVVD